ncbi:MAG: Uroporphyrinogen-III decarboxylase [Candidatus Lokiarchaeum sp. GC14_75]|nr:MAG: Uroporphyrinogen-III decarboxylase [Candidatus Lokiarchaeum sp. GC14_75]
MTGIPEEAMTSIERVTAAMELKEADRVPVWPMIDYLPKNYYDITAKEIIFNPKKCQKAYEWMYEKLGGFDIAMPGGAMYPVHINAFPIIFSAYYLDWRLPGRDLPDNVSPQLAERSLNDPILKVEDYDKLIEKGFFWLVNFKKVGIRDLIKLDKIGEQVAQNGERWWDYYKVPTFTDAAMFTPFEILSYFRGSTNFMKDVYRYPEKIREVSDHMIDGLIAMGKFTLKMNRGRTILLGCIRSSADFISEKHFEELVLPDIIKIVKEFLKENYIVQLHFDTDWTSRLHYLAELPKGKIYLHMDERTDIVKAKEILGDRMLIEGNFKPSLFTLGNPNIIEKRTKEIIDKCGEGGGLWVGCELPDDAKLENVKAMIDTCKTYGAYRK